MKAIDFPERNLLLAENQDEYETLPVHVEKGETFSVSMTACFELSDEEAEEIIKTRRIWYKQMIFGKQFQPMFITTQNPFE